MIIDKPLPSNWKSKRLKYLATYNDDVLSEATDDDQEIDYVEISGVSLVGGIEQTERMPFYQAPSRARRKVQAGDILVSTVRTYLKAIATVGDGRSDDLIASTGFCVIRPGDEMDSGYLGWVAKSEPFVGEVVARSVGVSYPAINASDLVNIDVPTPSIEVQRRIAKFLDEKVAQIDALINKKRALLERLAEQRQALITRAVTKGLNSDVPMKPSGVEWIGDIPASWEVLALRRLAMGVSTGRTPPSSEGDFFSDGEINWYTPTDFGGGLELFESRKTIIRDAISEGHAEIFPVGSVMLVSIGATLGKVAVCACEGSANQQINVIMLRECHDPYFVAYFLFDFREEVRMVSNGNTLGILNQSGVKSLLLPVPDLREQSEISNVIAGVEESFSSFSAQLQRSIDHLNDYRASLITSAITGQLPELNG